MYGYGCGFGGEWLWIIIIVFIIFFIFSGNNVGNCGCNHQNRCCHNNQ